MGSPLSASTATWGSALPASAAGCAVRVTLRTKNGDLDLKMATIISAWVSTEPRARFCLVFYRWLTVADEKVTLSMVQVKRKPQHLVFAAHSLYHLSKLPKSAVERRKPPHFVRVLDLPLLHFRCSPTTFVVGHGSISRLVPAARAFKGRERCVSGSICGESRRTCAFPILRTGGVVLPAIPATDPRKTLLTTVRGTLRNDGAFPPDQVLVPIYLHGCTLAAPSGAGVTHALGQSPSAQENFDDNFSIRSVCRFVLQRRGRRGPEFFVCRCSGQRCTAAWLRGCGGSGDRSRAAGVSLAAFLRGAAGD